jgi:outer membrane receptor protein involved in Fe transport
MIVSLCLGVAEAQVTTASVDGIVQDTSGAIVAGATVTIRNRDTGLERTDQTNEKGAYQLDFLPVGTYSLSISQPGFAIARRENMTLSAAQQLHFDVQLQAATANAEVNVTTSDQDLDTTNSQDTSTIEIKQLNQLPLAKQDWTTLLTQNTGSVKINSNTNSTFNLGLSLNGLPSAGFNMTVDGTNAAADPEIPLFGFYQAPNIINTIAHDAIQEVSIVKGVSSAAVGGAMSGSVNMITKSGTNHWHGTLSEINEISALDARSYFSSTKPRVTYNQYGAGLGGPIIKDKLFLFAAYEGARLSSFTTLTGTGPTPFALRVSPAIYQPYLHKVPLANQPSSDPADCATTTNPYINHCQWGGTVAIVGANQKFDSSISLRLDHNINSRNSWYVRYTRNRPYFNQPAFVPGNPQVTTAHGDVYNAGYVHVFSKLNSNTRFGWNRLRFNRGQLGFYSDNEGLSVQGIGPGPSELFIKSGKIITGDQEFSLTTGHHTFQFGGIVQWNDSARTDANTAAFTYPNLCPGTITPNGTSCAGSSSRNTQYINNTPSSVKIGLDTVPYSLYQWQFGGYFQDDWRVTDELTLNLGLRYDYYTVPKAQDGHIFNHGYDPVAGYGFGPFVDPNKLYDPDFHTGIQPRLGFAFAPKGTGTAVRGGFGIVTGRLPFFAGTIGMTAPASATTPSYQTLNAAQSAVLRFPIQHEDFGSAISFLQNTINPATRQPYVGTSFANSSMDPHHNNPYSMQWGLGIEQTMPLRMTFEMAYAGNVGLNETLTYLMNFSARGLPQGSPRIANPQWATFQRYVAGDRSNYHALQVKLRKSTQWGLLYGVNYTWAKSLSYGDANLLQGTSPQDLSNLRSDYGPSNYDMRNNFTANALWQVPFERWVHSDNTLVRVLGRGWGISGVVNANTGLPAPITNSASTFSADRPDAPTGNPYVDTYKAASSRHTYIVKSLFSAPAVTNGIQVRPGSIGRNGLRNVGQYRYDFSASKGFVFTESMRLDFRADAFNVTNHTNFTGLVTDYNSANFGVFQSAAPNRTIQLGGRFTF